MSVIKVVDGVTRNHTHLHTLVYISRERLPMCCCKSALRKGYLSLRSNPIAEPNASYLPAPRVTCQEITNFKANNRSSDSSKSNVQQHVQRARRSALVISIKILDSPACLCAHFDSAKMHGSGTIPAGR